MSKKIIHEYTKNIVCPYCGNNMEDVDNEVLRRMGDEEVIKCDNCEKSFIASASVDVSYITKKEPCIDNKHKWKKVHESCHYRSYEHVKTEKKYKWVALPEQKWTHVTRFECEKCGEIKLEHREITPEEKEKTKKEISQNLIVQNMLLDYMKSK